MNNIIEDDDQKAMALIWRVYGLLSDTAAIRFALRKLLREEEPHCVKREQRNCRSAASAWPRKAYTTGFVR
jgi:Arc/MetJ family transcription regulator